MLAPAYPSARDLMSARPSRLRVSVPELADLLDIGSSGQERAAEIAARTLALPDAQSVGDLTALLTSAGER